MNLARIKQPRKGAQRTPARFSDSSPIRYQVKASPRASDPDIEQAQPLNLPGSSFKISAGYPARFGAVLEQIKDHGVKFASLEAVGGADLNLGTRA